MKHIRLQKILCIFFVLSAGLSTHAQMQIEGGTMNDGVYFKPSDSPFNEQPDLLHETGYRVEQSDIQAPFVISKQTRAIFTANAGLRLKMPATTPSAFAPIVKNIFNYIETLQKKRAIAVKGKDGKTTLKTVSFEQENGITNWALAIKITRLAFCFSTEPKGVAAQIQEESSYNRQKPSNTGAVGFTQLTGTAIDEVNDQLGNRGVKGAQLGNIPYLAQAIHCYTGGKAFQPMFMSGVIPRGEMVTNNSKLRAKAKAWIMADIDRDLIYGQILLKVLLADAHDNGVLGDAAYMRAFKMYNGDPRQKSKYAREIVRTMQKI